MLPLQFDLYSCVPTVIPDYPVTRTSWIGRQKGVLYYLKVIFNKRLVRDPARRTGGCESGERSNPGPRSPYLRGWCNAPSYDRPDNIRPSRPSVPPWILSYSLNHKTIIPAWHLSSVGTQSPFVSQPQAACPPATSRGRIRSARSTRILPRVTILSRLP